MLRNYALNPTLLPLPMITLTPSALPSSASTVSNAYQSSSSVSNLCLCPAPDNSPPLISSGASSASTIPLPYTPDDPPDQNRQHFQYNSGQIGHADAPGVFSTDRSFLDSNDPVTYQFVGRSRMSSMNPPTILLTSSSEVVHLKRQADLSPPSEHPSSVWLCSPSVVSSGSRYTSTTVVGGAIHRANYHRDF